MGKVRSYLKDVFVELSERVTWPKWDQLMESTTIVLVAMLIISVAVWLVDLGLTYLLNAIYTI